MPFKELIEKTAAQLESARKNSEQAKNIAEQQAQKPEAEEKKATKEDKKKAKEAAKKKRKEEKQSVKNETQTRKNSASQRPDNSTQAPKIVQVKSPVQVPKEVKPTEEQEKQAKELTEEVLKAGLEVGRIVEKGAPTESDMKTLESNKNIFARRQNSEPSSGIKSWYLKHREQVPIFGTIATGLLFAGIMALVVATSVVALPVGIVAAIFMGFAFGVITGGISFGILYGCGPRPGKKKEITLEPEKEEVSENKDKEPAPGAGPAATTVYSVPTSASKAALGRGQGNHSGFSNSCREEAEKPSTQIPRPPAFVS